MSIQESADKIATMSMEQITTTALGPYAAFMEILESISNDINLLVEALNSQYTKGEQLLGIVVIGGIGWVLLRLLFKICDIAYVSQEEKVEIEQERMSGIKENDINNSEYK